MKNKFVWPPGRLIHLVTAACLFSALFLLCGCGGVTGTGIATPPSNPPSSPPAQILNVPGNWVFVTASTSQGELLGIEGNINQSGTVVSGTVHVFSFYEDCFDHLTAVGLTGTLTRSNSREPAILSLTSTSVDGVVISFSGNVNDNATVYDNAFTGTYTINGACTDQGSISGDKIPTLASTWDGTFTTSGGENFDVAANLSQSDSASAEGSFGVTGTATFQTPCFSSGTITSGVFPSGSFIIGNSVALDIQTGNGTVAFLGTADPAKGEITGDYTVSGGTCDQTGTATLTALGPWDY